MGVVIVPPRSSKRSNTPTRPSAKKTSYACTASTRSHQRLYPAMTWCRNYAACSAIAILKVQGPDGHKSLAYLDFGLLAIIPSPVRDALVCAVAQLIFEKDVEAVADLFGELDLLPKEVTDDPVKRAALSDALTKTIGEIRLYPTPSFESSPSDALDDTSYGDKLAQSTDIPTLRFDRLLDGLTRPRTPFQIPVPTLPHQQHPRARNARGHRPLPRSHLQLPAAHVSLRAHAAC